MNIDEINNRITEIRDELEINNSEENIVKLKNELLYLSKEILKVSLSI